MSPRQSWPNDVTAIVGGTFDPPHLGHLKAIEGLFENPRVKSVRVLPAFTPPQKSALSSFENRLNMLKLLLEPIQSKLPVEIDLTEQTLTQSGQPGYTFNLLTNLRPKFPNLAFVIGTDQLENLESWHRFPEVLTLSHWIVLARKPNGIESARKALSRLSSLGVLEPASGEWRVLRSEKRLILVETEAPALSSTELREMIAKNKTPTPEQLPASVLSYLKGHHLYGTT